MYKKKIFDALRQSTSKQMPRQLSAFGLIEVMIAALILSISLLGVASLQSKAMYTVVESGRLESAYQMINQLSSFALAANSNFVSYIAGDNNTDLSTLDVGVDTDCYYTSTNIANNVTPCTQDVFYKATVKEWQNILSTLLPNGQGCTCVTSNVSASTTPQSLNMLIAISWKTLSGNYTTTYITTTIPDAVVRSTPYVCRNFSATTTHTSPVTQASPLQVCNSNV